MQLLTNNVNKMHELYKLSDDKILFMAMRKIIKCKSYGSFLSNEVKIA